MYQAPPPHDTQQPWGKRWSFRPPRGGPESWLNLVLVGISTGCAWPTLARIDENYVLWFFLISLLVVLADVLPRARAGWAAGLRLLSFGLGISFMISMIFLLLDELGRL